VIESFGAAVNRGEKIAIIGRNGAGKTTLIRSLIGNAPGMNGEGLSIDSGEVKWGHEVQIGYFAQDHRQSIEPGLNTLDWLRQFDAKASTEELRGLLGQMLFQRDEAIKPVEALSGGEAARLLFCKIMLEKPNVLVLDEPTNHLDLESINALNIALQRYEGTLFLITHDHDVIEEVATRVWHFDHGKVEDFKGTYDEYTASVMA
jgi:ATPase subunit of ABC transporter with duplicated ATPase domains